jgi:hypothetical protein
MRFNENPYVLIDFVKVDIFGIGTNVTSMLLNKPVHNGRLTDEERYQLNKIPYALDFCERLVY